MTNQELLKICNTVSEKIYLDHYDSESVNKRLSELSDNGTTLSVEQQISFCILESHDFTRKMIYDVLLEVLSLEDNSLANDSIDT